MTFPGGPARGDPPRTFAVMPSHDQAMGRIVEELVGRCPARFVLVAERSGYLLTAAGERGSEDLSALASLVASDMAASEEIARRTGHDQSCVSTLREGPEFNSFLIGAGPDLVLFAQVSSEVPIGWARLLIQECGRQLVEVLGTPEAQVGTLDLGLKDDRLSAWFDDATSALGAG